MSFWNGKNQRHYKTHYSLLAVCKPFSLNILSIFLCPRDFWSFHRNLYSEPVMSSDKEQPSMYAMVILPYEFAFAFLLTQVIMRYQLQTIGNLNLSMTAKPRNQLIIKIFKSENQCFYLYCTKFKIFVLGKSVAESTAVLIHQVGQACNL